MTDNKRRQTILLVEDEPLISMTERMVLEKEGYRVLTASNGEDAVGTALGGEDIDLILMDINLGKGLDGTEAAERILSEKQLPIMFLSSHTEPEVVARTEGITGYGYILKNSGTTVLLASIRMAFRLYESRKREAETLKERERVGEALKALAESGLEGEDHILRFIVRELARALQVRYSLIARVHPDYPNLAYTLAVWTGEGFGENFTYELSGTPCRNVTEQGACLYPKDVTSLFPDDLILRDLQAESYWGTPLRDSQGDVLGIIAALDTKPMADQAWNLSLLQSFALRASQEIARDREVKDLSLELQERVKELQALLAIVQLLNDPKLPLRSAAEGMIEALVGAMQYPELTSVAITLSGARFTTPHFTRSELLLQESLFLGDVPAGTIQVYYSRNPLFGSADPFLPEERQLLRAVREQLLSFLDRKQSSLLLEKSEQRYRAMFEQSNKGICVIDVKSGILTECNPAFADLLGEGRLSLIGRSFEELGCGMKLNDLASRAGKRVYTVVKNRAGKQLELEVTTDLVTHRDRSLMQCTLSCRS